jgi:hypothetical protein
VLIPMSNEDSGGMRSAQVISHISFPALENARAPRSGRTKVKVGRLLPVLKL